VPEFKQGTKSARRIGAPHQDTEDIAALARDLGLSIVYVPSMRNGTGVREPATDRGSAILSTLPLSNPTAIELPIERQRRVALIADVSLSDVERLPVGVIHLDATDAAQHLRVFHARRWRATQAMALDSLLPGGPLVLGADLNTWMGHGEPASQYFRRLFGGAPKAGSTICFSGDQHPPRLTTKRCRTSTAPTIARSSDGSVNDPANNETRRVTRVVRTRAAAATAIPCGKTRLGRNRCTSARPADLTTLQRRPPQPWSQPQSNL
jgi:endonuclease/exonuclease/phosphatase family metal-dependent hydrolase